MSHHGISFNRNQGQYGITILAQAINEPRLVRPWERLNVQAGDGCVIGHSLGANFHIFRYHYRLGVVSLAL